MGRLHQVALAGRGAGVDGEHVLQWAEHQGERRAELVADVGEEGGLRPVQLGQRLGAPALVLVGLRRWPRAAAIWPATSARKPLVVGRRRAGTD